MSTCTETTATRAEQLASTNLAANLAAIEKRDGAIPELPEIASTELLFGRDGALTARVDGRWLRGCSVPTAAARAQLKSMLAPGQCACLLDPMHAAALRITLEKLRPEQAVIAIVPDAHHAALLLRCADLSIDISAGRCWIVFGDAWAAQLHALLQREEGLAIPTQFIRTPSPDASLADALIGPAQQVFSTIVGERKRELDTLRTSARPATAGAKKLCVVGGQRFKLWNDAGFALFESLRGVGADITIFNADSPTCATHVALARAATDCDAVVTADLFRIDNHGAVRGDVPWITWVTRDRLAPFADALPCDGLLVTDESLALAAQRKGWPAGRVAIATWPKIDLPAPTSGRLTLIADVAPLEPPADLEHLSSHRLLWEHLAARIARDPLAAHGRACELINESIAALQLDPASIAVARFNEQLVAPAYAVALARLLARAGVSLDIFGQGWNSFDDLAPFYRRPVTNRQDLDSIVREAGLIVHAWPATFTHPVEFSGRPVIRYAGGGVSGFITDARKCVAAPLRNRPSINLAAVLSLL